MSDAIYDMSIPELKEWLENWQKQKESQTYPVNLNDHSHLILVVRDLAQDLNATTQVLRGVLHRLDESSKET